MIVPIRLGHLEREIFMVCILGQLEDRTERMRLSWRLCALHQASFA